MQIDPSNLEKSNLESLKLSEGQVDQEKEALAQMIYLKIENDWNIL